VVEFVPEAITGAHGMVPSTGGAQHESFNVITTKPRIQPEIGDRWLNGSSMS
jgi:hypothetical protein